MKEVRDKSETSQRQREIRRIRLNDNQDIVVSIVDNEKLDIRVFVKSDSYTGPTKRGVRFYLLDDNWTEFKKLIDQVDKAYQAIA